MDVCKTFKIIPKEEFNRVFKESYSISAELDATCLCFEDNYIKWAKTLSKDIVIIDLGCSYNAQCYWFKDFNRLISVDLPLKIYGSEFTETRFKTDNCELYLTSIQDFINNILPTLKIDVNDCFAICSAVPDDNARELVKNTFPNCAVYYPGLEKYESLHFEDIPFEPEI